MKVVVLTWEYPPRVIGELAWRVQAQVERLTKRGLRIELVTISDSGQYHEEPIPGLRITRVSSPVSPQSTLITWIVSINVEVARVVSDIYHSEKDQLVLHSHDWHLAPAASALKKALKIPWVVSLYSLEQHRSFNPNSPLSSCIRTIEWHMAHDCDLLLVNSDWMSEEVKRLFSLREGAIILDPSKAGWEDEALRLYERLVTS